MGGLNIQRLLQFALVAGEPFDLASGDSLQILPAADDTGKIQVGDGSTDMDFEIYVGGTSNKVTFNVGDTRMQLTGVDINSDSAIVTSSNINCANLNVTGTVTPSGSGYIEQKVTALTANTTLNSTHYGGLLTNRGAGDAIVVTLPDPAAGNKGAWFDYIGVANQNVTFSGSSADKIVALNNAEVNSVAFTTTNEKIGASLKMVSDGTSWLVFPGDDVTLSITD